MAQYIELETRLIPLFVRAVVRGELAMHHTLSTDPSIASSWTITHIPSGRMIMVINSCTGARQSLKLLGTMPLVFYDVNSVAWCRTVVSLMRSKGFEVTAYHNGEKI